MATRTGCTAAKRTITSSDAQFEDIESVSHYPLAQPFNGIAIAQVQTDAVEPLFDDAAVGLTEFSPTKSQQTS